MRFFIQLLAAGITLGAVYALIAYGFGVTFRALNVVNFAHGNFMMIAAFATIAANAAGMWLPLALVVGILVSAIGVGVLERVAVRPVLKFPSGMGWITSTVGAGIVLQAIASLIWGAQAVRFPDLIFRSSDVVRIGGIALPASWLLILAVALFIMILFEVLRRTTLHGKTLQACAFDPDAARLRGIRVERTISFAFVLSGALAGLAGVLLAPITGVDPNFGFEVMLKGFVAAVIGGMGSPLGAIVGGIVVGVAEMMAGGYVGSAAREAISFAFLIIVLVFLPTGLFGDKVEARV